jgi:hypothetical protein
MRTSWTCLIGLSLTLLIGCDSEDDNSPTPDSGTSSVLPALAGYTVSVWAQGTDAYKAPDSIDSDGQHVWVGYQNASSKTGVPDAGPSTIVEYSLDGKTVVSTFTVAGHTDGLRVDPSGTKVWVTSNEDGNPALYSIDPTKSGSAAVTTYSLAATPHGGGYDDLWFMNGKMFIVGSNPTLDMNGANDFPALYTVTITGSTATVTAALMGNQPDVPDLGSGNPPMATVTLNEVDPDSLSVDSRGQLVLVNQAGQELVFLADAGTPGQTVTRVAVGTQLDDTVWIPTPSTGQLLVADGKANAIYSIQGPFTAGQIFTETPDDSGAAGFVGLLDVANASANGYAIVTPVVIGFKKPTGLFFLKQ